MGTCDICGTTKDWLVPAGNSKCIECMSDWELEQVDLSLVAEGLDFELARMEENVSTPAILRGDDRDEGAPIGKSAC